MVKNPTWVLNTPAPSHLRAPKVRLGHCYSTNLDHLVHSHWQIPPLCNSIFCLSHWNKQATCGVILWNHVNTLSLSKLAFNSFGIQKYSSFNNYTGNFTTQKTNSVFPSACISWHTILKKSFYFLSLSLPSIITESRSLY